MLSEITFIKEYSENSSIPSLNRQGSSWSAYSYNGIKRDSLYSIINEL